MFPSSCYVVCVTMPKILNSGSQREKLLVEKENNPKKVRRIRLLEIQSPPGSNVIILYSTVLTEKKYATARRTRHVYYSI
jgi:hypothetical protein